MDPGDEHINCYFLEKFLFVESMRVLVKYAWPSRFQNVVYFKPTKTNSNVDTTVFPDYLLTKVRENCNRYMRFAKLLVENQDFLSPFKVLSPSDSEPKGIGILYLDNYVLYDSIDATA